MENNLLPELAISLVLLILLVPLVNPFGFWMPTTMLMMTVAGLVGMFVVFAGFLWRACTPKVAKR